jgi:hypothetical protein
MELLLTLNHIKEVPTHPGFLAVDPVSVPDDPRLFVSRAAGARPLPGGGLPAAR